MSIIIRTYVWLSFSFFFSYLCPQALSQNPSLISAGEELTVVRIARKLHESNLTFDRYI